MSKQSVAELEAQLKAKDRALDVARTALMRVANTKPTTFIKNAGSLNGRPAVVQAFEAAQARAERGLLDMSDAEVVA